MRTNLAQFAKLHRQLTDERRTLQSRLQAINEALGDMPLPSLAATEGAGKQTAARSNGRGRRGGMSEAGRARIAAAQRARWAKLRGKATPGENSMTRKPKRKMSAAARKAIAAAAKKRWAAAKAAGKNKL